MASTLAGLLACGSALPGSEASGVGSTSAGTSSDSPTGGSWSSSTGGTTGVAGETTAESSAGATSGTSSGFLAPIDGVVDEGPCNPFTQNCPPGEKCIPYADDGGSEWNNDRCVPVMEHPAQVDEPCIAPEGGVSGIDNCDLGLMCWDVDAEGEGYCVALCKGSMEEGYCEEPEVECHIYSGGALALCERMCDPVLQDCHGSLDLCIGNPNGKGFLCVLDASGEEGQIHDSCNFANACDPGLFCSDPSAAVECDQDAMGCCEPFCDLNDPACPGVGQVCNPYFKEGMAPLGFEHVGYCAVPE